MYPEPIVILFSIFAGMFGAVIGSFLNVCIHRLPRGYLSIVYPASHCIHCGKAIAWYDNIPILSWIILGGACRYCRSLISIRYVVVELLTAVLFIIYVRLIFLKPISPFVNLDVIHRGFVTIISLYLLSTLIVITFIDISYRIIPDSITYPGIVLAPLLSALFPVLHTEISWIPESHLAGFIASLLGILVGGGSLYIVGVIGKIVFRKEAMGLGDVKLMAMVGGFLGWDAALVIFVLACLLGTVLGVLSLCITKDHYVPFGPYLAISTWITILFKEQILYIGLTAWPGLVSGWLGTPGGY